MRLTTIRSTLLSLIGALGAVILVLVALQLADLNTLRQEAKHQFDANLARNKVARAALALARERDSYFLALTLGTTVRPETILETDRSFAAFENAADLIKLTGGEADTIVAELVTERVPTIRQAANQALTLPVASIARQQAASRWFTSSSQTVIDLLAFRIRLLSQGDSISAELFGLYYLRTHTLTLLDELMKNAAWLEVDVARQASVETAGALSESTADTPQVTKAASEVALSVGPFEEFLTSLGGQGLGPGNNAFDAEIYAAAEQRLRTALADGDGVEEAHAYWKRVSNAAILQLDELQAATFGLTQDGVQALATEARRSILVWTLVLWASAVIVVIAVKIVLEWVVGPLERMREAMLQLAEDNLAVDIPKHSKLKEIDAMDDALRVFKANGMRRQNLQKERLRLHGRLEETYGHLKTDLEAAAVIQASLLPQQAELGGVSLSSYFRPSHFLAGDTFDVLHQPDGRK
jgi:HAMP domain-containing protein